MVHTHTGLDWRRPSKSVTIRELTETQSTNPNQKKITHWLHPFLIQTLKGQALLHFRHLYDASTDQLAKHYKL